MKNKGITLVALIITVIILLILATVSISLIINNGILDKAQHGVNRYSEEEELEQIKLAVASARLKGNGFLDTENLNSELQDRFGKEAEWSENSKIWSLELDKNYKIYEDGRVEESQSILPAEYQQVEYIESSGTQYIDTKIKNDIKFGYIQSKFQITSINDSRYYLFGCYSKGGKNRLQFSFSNPFFIGIGNNYTNSLVNEKMTTNPIIVKFTTTHCIVNNETIYSSSGYSNISDSININLFSCNNIEGYNDFKAKDMRIFYFYIYNDENKLVREFIPCHSTTTVTDVDGTERPAGTVGLYDTVEGKFYTNKGTGTFGYGTLDGTYVAPTNN